MYQPIVEIKTPCHENLNKMAPGEKGRFCNACATTVIDFTNKTPEEITAYFMDHKQEKKCGIFNRNDVSTGYTDRALSFFHKGRLRFLALFIISLLVLTGCRTRKSKSLTYGTPRLMDKKNPSKENLK